MTNCPKCKKSDEVVTRPDGTKYCLDCGERVAERPSDATLLLADLKRIKREIFTLRNHPGNTEKAQAHMDTAREYLRAATVAIEFDSANR